MQKVCQKSKNAILSVKNQCFDTPTMISLISVIFFEEFIPLPKLLFQHGQGRQNTKENKAFYHYILNQSGSR